MICPECHKERLENICDSCESCYMCCECDDLCEQCLKHEEKCKCWIDVEDEWEDEIDECE